MAAIGIEYKIKDDNIVEYLGVSLGTRQQVYQYNSGDLVRDWYNAIETFYNNDGNRNDILNITPDSIMYINHNESDVQIAYLYVNKKPKLSYKEKNPSVLMFVPKNKKLNWEELKESVKH